MSTSQRLAGVSALLLFASSSGHALSITGYGSGSGFGYLAAPSVGNNPGIATAYSMGYVPANGAAAIRAVGLLNALNPTRYTAATSSDSAAASLNVLKYSLEDTGEAVRLNLAVDYTAVGDSSYVWVQIVDTTAPLNGLSSPYVDNTYTPPGGSPRPHDPFYYPDGLPNFPLKDSPTRAKPPQGQSVDWRASAFLVSTSEGVDGKTTLTVHDGISWGFGLVAYTNDPGNPRSPGSSSMTVGSVPEAPTMVLFLPFCAIVLRNKHARDRRNKK